MSSGSFLTPWSLAWARIFFVFYQILKGLIIKKMMIKSSTLFSSKTYFEIWRKLVCCVFTCLWTNDVSCPGGIRLSAEKPCDDTMFALCTCVLTPRQQFPLMCLLSDCWSAPIYHFSTYMWWYPRNLGIIQGLKLSAKFSISNVEDASYNHPHREQAGRRWLGQCRDTARWVDW